MKKGKILYIIGLSILLFFICDRAIGWALNRGLDNYFGLTQHSDLLLVGHSELMLAVDKQGLEKETGLSVSKYCREGVDVNDRYEMLRQYFESPYADSLKYVLYGVDQYMFNSNGLSQNSYKLFYPFIDEMKMDAYIKDNASFTDYWLHKLIHTSRYSDALINSAQRGWRDDWSNYKYGFVDVENLKKEVQSEGYRKIVIEPQLKGKFEETLTYLNSKKVKTILVLPPITDIVNNKEPDKYKEIIEYFEDLETAFPNVVFWDLNPGVSSKYDLFIDGIHLNVDGQKAVNAIIAEKIKNLVKE